MIRQFGRSWSKYAPLRLILTPSRKGGISGAAPIVGCYLELSVAIPELRSIEVSGVRGSFARVPGWWRVAGSSRCIASAEMSIVILLSFWDDSRSIGCVQPSRLPVDPRSRDLARTGSFARIPDRWGITGSPTCNAPAFTSIVISDRRSVGLCVGPSVGRMSIPSINLRPWVGHCVESMP